MSGGHTPPDDRVFAAAMADLGCIDHSRWTWSRTEEDRVSGEPVRWDLAGERGVGPADMSGPPDGFPKFRYGREAGSPYLTIAFGGILYTRRGDVVRVYLADVLPESVLSGSIGRRLDGIVDLPGIGAAIIVDAGVVAERGVAETMLTIG